jgi:hypothetical protein
VHHKDDDWDNNDPSNLEALTRSQHMLRHREKFRTPEHRALLARIRPLALEGSKRRIKKIGVAAYKEECRARGAASWANAKFRQFVCAECGRRFESRFYGTPRFCSKKCKGKAREKRRASLRRERKRAARVLRERDSSS